MLQAFIDSLGMMVTSAFTTPGGLVSVGIYLLN